MIFSQKRLELKNSRALLRPIQTSDLYLFSVYVLNEPETWKFSLVQPNTLKSMSLYIKNARIKRKKNEAFTFTIYDKQLNQVAGSTRYYDFDVEKKTVKIGYTWMGKRFRGTGLNKNIKWLMLKYAFDEMGMETVVFEADSLNALSIAAMKSIGCKVKEILPNTGMRADGTMRDSIVLTIDKMDWYETVGPALAARLSQF